MSDDSVIYETADLTEGYLASVCAIFAPVEVLRGEFELAAVYLEAKRLKGNGAWRKNHLDFARWLNAVAELI